MSDGIPFVDGLVRKGRKLRDVLENGHERAALEWTAICAAHAVLEVAPRGSRLDAMARAALFAAGVVLPEIVVRQ